MPAFEATCQLRLPPDDGGGLVTVGSDSLSGSYATDARYDLTFVSAGSTSLNFGTVGMAKGLLIKFGTGTGYVPVEVRFNGAVSGPSHSPGSVLFSFDPDPEDGITSIDLVYAGPARVQVWLLGDPEAVA